MLPSHALTRERLPRDERRRQSLLLQPSYRPTQQLPGSMDFPRSVRPHIQDIRQPHAPHPGLRFGKGVGEEFALSLVMARLFVALLDQAGAHWVVVGRGAAE